MSDTEAPQQPTVKPAKRQMTPEARERMLANLKKGREAKAKKLAERKKLLTPAQTPEPERENSETLAQNTETPLWPWRFALPWAGSIPAVGRGHTPLNYSSSPFWSPRRACESNPRFERARGCRERPPSRPSG